MLETYLFGYQMYMATNDHLSLAFRGCLCHAKTTFVMCGCDTITKCIHYFIWECSLFCYVSKICNRKKLFLTAAVSSVCDLHCVYCVFLPQIYKPPITRLRVCVHAGKLLVIWVGISIWNIHTKTAQNKANSIPHEQVGKLMVFQSIARFQKLLGGNLLLKTSTMHNITTENQQFAMTNNVLWCSPTARYAAPPPAVFSELRYVGWFRARLVSSPLTRAATANVHMKMDWCTEVCTCKHKTKDQRLQTRIGKRLLFMMGETVWQIALSQRIWKTVMLLPLTSTSQMCNGSVFVMGKLIETYLPATPLGQSNILVSPIPRAVGW